MNNTTLQQKPLEIIVKDTKPQPLTIPSNNVPAIPNKEKIQAQQQMKNIINPLKSAAIGLACMRDSSRNKVDFHALTAALDEQIQDFHTQGQKHIEDLLYTQVLSLQQIFETGLTNIGPTAQPAGKQSWAHVALKAQNQSLKTLVALAELKNPRPLSFIKQQNNAFNQQINNEPSTIISKNELLEVK